MGCRRLDHNGANPSAAHPCSECGSGPCIFSELKAFEPAVIAPRPLPPPALMLSIRNCLRCATGNAPHATVLCPTCNDGPCPYAEEIDRLDKILSTDKVAGDQGEAALPFDQYLAGKKAAAEAWQKVGACQHDFETSEPALAVRPRPHLGRDDLARPTYVAEKRRRCTVCGFRQITYASAPDDWGPWTKTDT